MPTHPARPTALPAAPSPAAASATASATATAPARVRVLVTDEVGLQRVVTMLLGRQHAFTRLEAEEAGGERWTVTLDLLVTEHQLDLVTSRLDRLPSVLSVDVTTPTALAVPA
ncbi:hypothetical protein [Modestobacter versicolor]|uniref:hypothetical protein n=1 Tax=Modestobacter versicolor TaxID=429133 RepID=UPI0034DF1E48